MKIKIVARHGTVYVCVFICMGQFTHMRFYLGTAHGRPTSVSIDFEQTQIFDFNKKDNISIIKFILILFLTLSLFLFLFSTQRRKLKYSESEDETGIQFTPQTSSLFCFQRRNRRINSGNRQSRLGASGRRASRATTRRRTTRTRYRSRWPRCRGSTRMQGRPTSSDAPD